MNTRGRQGPGCLRVQARISGWRADGTDLSGGVLTGLGRLVGLGEALRGARQPGAVPRAAWEELRGVIGAREAWLEVRGAGGVQTFGRRRPAAGDETFSLGGRRGPAGALVVGRSVAGREQPLRAGERQALKVAAALLGLFVEKMELAREAAGEGADALTGCRTRRDGLARIGAEVRRVGERGREASLIFLDVDDLKGLNDRYGHWVGDRVLAEVGAVLRDGVRGSDVRCRYGGDEFLVLLRDTPCDGALETAERLRAELARRRVAGSEGAVAAAASFGVSTTWAGECEAGELVARADAAMYRAKRGGGNAVRAWRGDRRMPAAVGAAAGPALEV